MVSGSGMPANTEGVFHFCWARRRFADVGWNVGDIQAIVDWEDKPVTAAAMTIRGAIALVTCQAARHVNGRSLRLPKDAEYVVIVSAFYELVAPLA